jgi:hypothetical protein
LNRGRWGRARLRWHAGRTFRDTGSADMTQRYPRPDVMVNIAHPS